MAYITAHRARRSLACQECIMSLTAAQYQHVPDRSCTFCVVVPLFFLLRQRLLTTVLLTSHSLSPPPLKQLHSFPVAPPSHECSRHIGTSWTPNGSILSARWIASSLTVYKTIVVPFSPSQCLRAIFRTHFQPERGYGS